MNTGRKITGGKYHQRRKKRLYEFDSKPRTVKLGAVKRKCLRIRSGKCKTILMSSDIANVLNKKTGKIKQAKIKNVAETPSNRFLARQNVLVKGAIIETELGKARVTNRPSQEGSINAVLLDNQ
jgi:small subunit ribosomal protein S8e